MRVGFGVYHPSLVVSEPINSIQSYLGFNVSDRVKRCLEELKPEFVVVHWSGGQLEELREVCERWGSKLVLKLTEEAKIDFIGEELKTMAVVSKSLPIDVVLQESSEMKQSICYVEVSASTDMEDLRKLIGITADRVILDLRGLHSEKSDREDRFILPVLEAAIGGYFLQDKVDVVFYHPLAHAVIKLLKEGKATGRKLADYVKLVSEARE